MICINAEAGLDGAYNVDAADYRRRFFYVVILRIDMLGQPAEFKLSPFGQCKIRF